MSLKDLVRKIRNYKNVRLINDKMFAAENGYLEFNFKINKIITNPQNKFILNNNEVQFLGACEVLEIEIDDQLLNTNTQIPQSIFAHLQPVQLENIDNVKILESAPYSQNEIKEKDNLLNDESLNNNTKEIKKEYITILDTNVIDFYKLNLNNYKRGISVIKSSHANNIVMGPKTSTFINLNSIKPNTEYLFSIDGERLRGNGKFKIGFSQNNLKEIIFNERTSNFKFTLKTNNEKNDSILLLRPDNSLGSVNIKRVVISEKDPDDHSIGNSTQNTIPIINKLPANNINVQQVIVKNVDTNTFISHFNDNFYKTVNTKISSISKNNAVFYKQKFIPNVLFDLSFTVAPLTLSSKKWISKILPFFSNAKIYKKIFNFKDLEKSDKIDFAICSIDNVISSDNIFLEEWVGEIQDKNIIDLLNKSKNIFVNSITNEIELNFKLNGPKIIRFCKIWPALSVDNKIINSKYILYLEKDENITKNLVQSLGDKLNKLIVVGSRLKLPDSIKQYSEYEDYNTINNLIYNSSLLLDISNNNHYKSSVIDLACNYNIPIVTNNYNYINTDNVSLIKNYDIDSIKKYFDNKDEVFVEFTRKNNLNYNLEIKNLISKIIGS